MKIFEGKNYFVSGITSGIGKETAEAIISKGGNVYSITRDKIDIQDKIKTVELNLKDVEKIEASLNFLLDEIKLDGIVLCAGIEKTIPIRQTTFDQIYEIFKINFFSNYEIIRVLHRKKNLNNNSAIVLVTSIMAEFGTPGKTAYSASKSAINGLVKSLALELAPRNIRVNAVAPAMVKTRMGLNLIESLTEENLNNLEKSHPLGFAEPSQISDLINFLISDNSSNITGQILNIDGGFSIQ